MRYLDCGNDRIIFIQVTQLYRPPIYIFSTYIPSQKDIVIYKENLQVLYDIMSFYNDKGKVIIGGDFNASLMTELT